MPCQSGRKAAALAGLVLIAVSAPVVAGPTGWAHQAAGFQSNGAVTVKSLAGGAYGGTQNPTGAVVKANQNAATQAPTVIIQATSSSYAEAFPMVVVGTSTVPTCPSGYNSVWSASATNVYAQTSFGNPIYNVGGTRFTFGAYYESGNWYVGYFSDNTPTTGQGNAYSMILYAPATYFGNGSTRSSWAANMCTK